LLVCDADVVRSACETVHNQVNADECLVVVQFGFPQG
jgi:hypothetical protein